MATPLHLSLQYALKSLSSEDVQGWITTLCALERVEPMGLWLRLLDLRAAKVAVPEVLLGTLHERTMMTTTTETSNDSTKLKRKAPEPIKAPESAPAPTTTGPFEGGELTGSVAVKTFGISATRLTQLAQKGRVRRREGAGGVYVYSQADLTAAYPTGVKTRAKRAPKPDAPKASPARKAPKEEPAKAAEPRSQEVQLAELLGALRANVRVGLMTEDEAKDKLWERTFGAG